MLAVLGAPSQRQVVDVLRSTGVPRLDTLHHSQLIRKHSKTRLAFSPLCVVIRLVFRSILHTPRLLHTLIDLLLQRFCIKRLVLAILDRVLECFLEDPDGFAKEVSFGLVLLRTVGFDVCIESDSFLSVEDAIVWRMREDEMGASLVVVPNTRQRDKELA